MLLLILILFNFWFQIYKYVVPLIFFLSLVKIMLSHYSRNPLSVVQLIWKFLIIM